ncbi:MAG: histidine--tRNA ligase [Alphaproteobacteria bacterium]|nr:histidine--tRNA ligase [Alphaproteobacteria bacterium]MBU0796173.1 histidine--tRNA ligase [Alphaproteobacteria bacterium]MBU0888048.1 histidine--tRNA ligase [Alphaproteobacteria bacterium]MBU1812993.1 histidine--tRNA ligase [Alphaproteobacteria bacterium]MBU2089474.1 histidine--tRNA ligase [Alphaproteobacteria bacterium]
MASLQPARGTHDLLPEDFRRHARVIDIARETAGLYGFAQIATPIFEFTDVFQRTLGDTSDIVTKEMYTFTDKGGEQVTLRPEGTAGVARALISNGLSQHLPLKYFYAGPMFRYERPQKGRLRQFHQIGVELLGVAGPQADVDVLATGQHILEALGIWQHTRLELNTLGDPESRDAYRAALVAYFSDHLETLSPDSRERLSRNPLRILDSKDEGDRKLVAGAPGFGEYLNQLSQDFFGQVTEGLTALGIPYTHNPRLVRGLDYYTHTAFEFVTEALGAQGTVMAGGRYDGLVGMMGGPQTPGIGWAAGIERLAMLLTEVPEAPRPIAIIPVGGAEEAEALRVAHRLRRAGYVIELGYGGNVGKRMKRANKLNARAALLLGEAELARQIATLRDLDSGEQVEVPLDQLEDRLSIFR